MVESLSIAEVMDFVKTLTSFSVIINKSMLVIDEEAVQHILPSIAYLDQAIENLEGFHNKI